VQGGSGKSGMEMQKGISINQPQAAAGMPGMSGMGNSMVQAGILTTKVSTSASEMGGNAMGNAVSGGMSDVLRIQMERAELEDNLKNLLSERQVAEAQFNTLLNRPIELPVIVPDSLKQKLFDMDYTNALNRILTDNPMVTMLEAEADAYRAKAKMDKRMSMPMIGIGIQYSPMRKMETSMGMSGMNGKDMWMPMLKVTLPIFRKKYNAQQRESRLYWKASELKRENVQNQLRTEYINLYSQLEEAGRKVDLYSKQFTLSQTVWQLVVQEFAAGRQSLTDVIAVERQLLDYKLKKSEAIAVYNTGVAAMEKLISNSLNGEER
ncbi:TolC family protein, partial [Bacteroides heparinolyticus]